VLNCKEEGGKDARARSVLPERAEGEGEAAGVVAVLAEAAQ
jgi:hypothetical protein